MRLLSSSKQLAYGFDSNRRKSVSATFLHVPHVVDVRTEFDVMRIAADRVVTLVTNYHVLRYLLSEHEFID